MDQNSTGQVPPQQNQVPTPQNPQVQNQSPPPAPKPTQTHNNNKVLLIGAAVFLLLVLVATAAYLLFFKQNQDSQQATQPTPTVEQETQPSPTKESDPTANWSTVRVEKLENLVYPGFTIKYPSGWQAVKEFDDILQTLTIEKEGSSIVIYRAPHGGAGCVFEGEAEGDFLNDYTEYEYVDVKVGDIMLRRIVPKETEGEVTHSFCSNSTTNPEDFNIPTQFGLITYVQEGLNEEMLVEMDRILQTITPIP